MYIMSKEACKLMDEKTIDIYKIPSLILMENAAEQIYRDIRVLGNKYVIICGIGNNGGDGLAIGRKLLIEGKDVTFIMIKPKEKASSEYITNLEIIKKLQCNIIPINAVKDFDILKLELNSCDIIIDSILGIGINRPLDEFYNELIDIINEHSKKIISVDVPSGLDANTGKPLGNAIKANITYTFEVIKKGFLNYQSFDYLGDLKVVNIGIPLEVKEIIDEKMYILENKEYGQLLKKRSIYGHKGDYGKAIIFAGSYGFLGAAKLATRACVNTGTGLTTLVTSKEGQQLLSSEITEAMLSNYNDIDRINKLLSSCNSIAFGPGVNENEEMKNLLDKILDSSTVPLVIDASGINILSKNRELLKKLNNKVILTPHPGEMSRLVNKDISYINENRIEVAKKFAKENQCIVLLKGFNTIISDGNKVYINKSGNSKMASGGMGDTLTGIIASLLAQGHNILESALLGAYIHGLAGQVASKDKYSVTASEVIDNISKAMNII